MIMLSSVLDIDLLKRASVCTFTLAVGEALHALTVSDAPAVETLW